MPCTKLYFNPKVQLTGTLSESLNKTLLFENKAEAVACDGKNSQRRKIEKKIKRCRHLFRISFLASICRPSLLTHPRILLSGIQAAAASFQTKDALRLSSDHICSNYSINTARNRKGQTGKERSLAYSRQLKNYLGLKCPHRICTKDCSYRNT